MKTYKEGLVSSAPQKIKQHAELLTLNTVFNLSDEEFDELVKLNILIDCYLVVLLIKLGGVKNAMQTRKFNKEIKITVDETYLKRCQELLSNIPGIEHVEKNFCLNSDLGNEGTLDELLKFSMGLSVLTGFVK